jgi:hypothetical protein
MIPEDLLFWIAPLATSPTPDENVLCRRHADAMVVPLGWTLDDRRDETPRLFRPRPPVRTVQPRASVRRGSSKKPVPEAHVVEQLVLDGTGDIPRPSVADLSVPVELATVVAVEVNTHVTDVPAEADPAAGDEPPALPWSLAFDHDDDLDGLLQVDSPLLARAFRGTGRRRN